MNESLTLRTLEMFFYTVEPHQPLTKRQKITRHQVEELEDDEDEAGTFKCYN